MLDAANGRKLLSRLHSSRKCRALLRGAAHVPGAFGTICTKDAGAVSRLPGAFAGAITIQLADMPSVLGQARRKAGRSARA
jgi:hypothetical protein